MAIGNRWSGFRPMQWGMVSIAAPTGPSTSAPAMYIGLDGADRAILRPIAVGMAGGTSLALSIHGVTVDVSDDGQTPTGKAMIYVPQLLASYSTLTLGASSVLNAYGRAVVNYYDRIQTESIVGSCGAPRAEAFEDGADWLAFHSPGSGGGAGVSEIYLDNLGGFDLLAVGLAVVQLSGTVSAFNMLANLRNGGV